jgi:hypothetical protein
MNLRVPENAGKISNGGSLVVLSSIELAISTNCQWLNYPDEGVRHAHSDAYNKQSKLNIP